MEKTYQFGNSDWATSGVLLPDSTYLISHLNSRYNINYAFAKCFLRVNKNLDTLSSFRLPETGIIDQLIRLDSTKVLAVGTTNTAQGKPKGRADCYDINYNRLWSINFDSLSGFSFIKSACIDTSGFVYLCGYQDLDSVNGFNSRIFCMRLTSFGAIDWFKFYTWGSPLQTSASIAQMENGNFMVGGTTGALIVGMEIDQYGNIVTPLTTFFTPDTLFYITNTIIQPLPRNKYLIRGLQQRGNVCLAVTDRQGVSFWREYKQGGAGFPHVHSADGSFTINRQDKDGSNSRIERIRSDGTLIWRLPYPNPIPFQEYRGLYGILPSYDGTGLGYGYYVNLRMSILLTKIANVGYPAPPLFTPSTISETAVSVYPNPAVERVLLTIPLSEPEVSVALINMQGQSFTGLAAQTLGGYEVNLSQLSAGLYHVRASVGGKRYVARVVKQ